MQVEVWPNAPARTEYPLPAPLDGTTTLRSVIVRIDDKVLLCVRIDPQDLEVREVLHWSKEKGFERLEVELGGPNPQVIVTRRLLWFLDDDKPLGPHAKIHILTPDSSYTGELHDVECSFVTPQGERWVMHWMFHPHRERMSTTMSAYMSWTNCLTVVDDGRNGGVVHRWSKNYEDPTYESGVFGTTETGGCDFEACGKYGNDYIVKLPSLDVVPISGHRRAVMKGPPNPPEEARYMRAFMGRGWGGTTIYLSGAGRLFRYETSSSESRSRRRSYSRHMDVSDDTWVDIRVPGCGWIAADGLLSSNAGDMCMFALAGDVLTISEVSPYQRDRPDSYSHGFSGRMIDEDLERMYDVILRIGHTDFKVIASVFCLASQSDVLRNLFFGAFSENIHSSKQARHERVMDLTELVGDCPDAFASIHTYLMRDSRELDTGFTTLDIVIQVYRVCRVLGLRSVEYEVEEHICFKYLATDKVMELIADLDVDDTSAQLRGKCAAGLLTLVVNAADKAQEWARIREKMMMEVSLLVFLVLACVALAAYAYSVWHRFTHDSLDEDIRVLESILHAMHRKNVKVLMRTIKLGYADVSVTHAACVRGGGAERKTVVLVHGAAGTSMSFVHAIPEFAQEFNVIAIELPGFGRSVIRNQSVLRTYANSTDFYCTVLDRCLTHMGFSKDRQVVLCGHSYGGYLGIRFCHLFPAAVSHLALVCPAGILPTLGTRGFFWSLLFKYTVKRFLQRFWVCSVVVRYLCFDRSDAHTSYWYSVLMHPRNDGDDIIAERITLEGYTKAYWNSPALDDLRGLSMPVLAMFGEHDPIIPAKQSAVVEQACGHQVHVIPSADHAPLSSPEGSAYVVKKIRDFVEAEPLISKKKDSGVLGPAHEYASSPSAADTDRTIDRLYRDCGVVH